MRKAQAAMEYLMSYGWAIIVVLIVFGAFVYAGVLRPLALVPDKCIAPSGFFCESFSYTEAGSLSILLAPQVTGTSAAVTFESVVPSGLSIETESIPSFERGKNILITVSVTGEKAPAVGRKLRASFDIAYTDDFGQPQLASGGDVVVTRG
ncbi:MAG TPA: hypothetical protein ENN46_04510 [Candidatus Woesearchaeota archaeon]|nr:hypothetical protein [Candidatus Woesearchaeota archaeon]